MCWMAHPHTRTPLLPGPWLLGSRAFIEMGTLDLGAHETNACILTRKEQSELEAQRPQEEATKAEWGLEGCNH